MNGPHARGAKIRRRSRVYGPMRLGVFAMVPILSMTACSRPSEPGVGPDPSPPAAKVAASPAPPGQWKFGFSRHHEMSCSQSFESTSDWGRYELAIEAGGAASLTIATGHSNTFGPSESKFKLGSSSHTETRSRASYLGQAKGTSDALEIAFAPDEVACKAAGAKCGGPFQLRCGKGSVEAKTRATVDAGPATIRVAVLRCTPAIFVHADLAAATRDGLPFAQKPGLDLAVDDFGGWHDTKPELYVGWDY
jgi:hypothetical protein